MILDGVTPWGYRVFYDFRDTVPRAIQLVLDRCAEDPDCSEAFPDLRNEFLVVLDRLKAEPAQVRLSDSKTGEPVDITLTHDKFLRFRHAPAVRSGNRSLAAANHSYRL